MPGEQRGLQCSFVPADGDGLAPAASLDCADPDPPSTTAMHPTLPPGFSRLHELLEPWVRRDADALALRDPHSTFTFGGLQQASVQAAATLGSLGVRAGDRVLV